MAYNPNAQPGDPDFDWSTYNQWHAAQPDRLAEAKQTLADTQPQADRFSLLNENAKAATDQTPSEAFTGELGRTASEAAAGLAHSPVDFLSNMGQLVRHPIDSIGNVVKSVTTDLPENVSKIWDPKTDPRAAGSLLGQILIGEYAAPPIAKGAVKYGPEAIEAAGAGISRGGQALTTGRGGMSLPGFGAMEALLRSDPKGLLLAGAPYAMQGVGKATEYAGKGLGALRDMFMKPEAPAVDPYAPNVSGVDKTGRPSGAKSVPYTQPTDYNRAEPNMPNTTGVSAPSEISRYEPSVSGYAPFDPEGWRNIPTHVDEPVSGEMLQPPQSGRPLADAELSPKDQTGQIMRDQRNLSAVEKWTEKQQAAREAAAEMQAKASKTPEQKLGESLGLNQSRIDRIAPRTMPDVPYNPADWRGTPKSTLQHIQEFEARQKPTGSLEDLQSDVLNEQLDARRTQRAGEEAKAQRGLGLLEDARPEFSRDLRSRTGQYGDQMPSGVGQTGAPTPTPTAADFKGTSLEQFVQPQEGAVEQIPRLPEEGIWDRPETPLEDIPQAAPPDALSKLMAAFNAVKPKTPEAPVYEVPQSELPAAKSPDWVANELDFINKLKALGKNRPQ